MVVQSLQIYFLLEKGEGETLWSQITMLKKKSKSKKLKSRYQSGIYSHVKRWVYLLFVCLFVIYIYLLSYYILDQSNKIDMERLIMPNSYPFNYITHLTGAWYT